MSRLSRRSFLGGVAAGAVVAATGAKAAGAASRASGHVILLALDGFDWEYLDGRVELPNITALTQRGSLSPSTGVMASVTNPSWTSMSCGTWPDATKNAAYWFDEAAGIARGQSRDSAVEGIGQALRRQGLTIGSAQWFIMQGKGVDYGDPKGLYTQPGGRIGKRVDDAIAMLTGQQVRSGSTTVTLPEPPDFLAVYSSDIDGDGHAYGPNAPEMLDTLRETDEEIGRLIRTVKDVDLWGRTTWILTADHGMSEWRIPQGPAAIQALADAGFTCEVLGSGQRPTNPATQIVIVTGGSCSVHLLGDLKHDSAAVARVRDALLAVEGVKVVHDREQQRALRMAPQYGELIVEVNEPYSLYMTSPREGADGLHGGQAEMAVPLILSGHRVRPGALPRAPRHVDVAPTIAHLLGAEPPAAAEGRVLAEVLLDA